MDQGSQGFVLIGGIGSGKSFVAELFRDRGVTMIEADRIGHEVLEPGGAAYQAVADAWPEVLRDGAIDRAALGKIVFADRSELDRLEAFTHPAIAAEIQDRVESAHTPLVGVERPIIGGMVGEGLPVVVVDAPDDVRIERLLGRGMDIEDIQLRMSAQPARSAWLAAADVVIDNAPGSMIGAEVDGAITWLSHLVTDKR